jgi:lipoate-protein ligase B
MTAKASNKFIGWLLNLDKVEYERALEMQLGLVKLRKNGMARDTLILVEHPPVITVGKDGHKENFENLKIKPFFIERGGDVTYHGPGQLVVYFIFNLTRRGRDLHLFMQTIQEGIIAAMKQIGIKTEKGDEHTGVWVGKNKIASIGVAVKNWISYHGAAINLNTDLNDFTQINPCGLDAGIMISAEKLKKKKIDIEDFKNILLAKYSELFDTHFYPVKLEEIAEDIKSQSGSNVI